MLKNKRDMVIKTTRNKRGGTSIEVHGILFLYVCTLFFSNKIDDCDLIKF
jgi:hypothetical protein